MLTMCFTNQQLVLPPVHISEMTIAEMKACWEAEKSKALSDLKKKLQKEKEESVADTKKKQWVKKIICVSLSVCDYMCLRVCECVRRTSLWRTAKNNNSR